MSVVSFPRFAWSCGEEGSDPLVSHEGAIVRVDEFARSGHLERQDEDLAAVAALGVRVWRYGMPWRQVERAPGVYDWSLWDRALAACERHGLEPVVDLCHFGLPDHYRGFCEPDWVDGFVRYVEAFLARYPAPRWFTPVNEPCITAMYSALVGIWNERGVRTPTSPTRSVIARSRISRRWRGSAPIAMAGGSARRASRVRCRRGPSMSRRPSGFARSRLGGLGSPLRFADAARDGATLRRRRRRAAQPDRRARDHGQHDRRA